MLTLLLSGDKDTPFYSKNNFWDKKIDDTYYNIR